MLPGPYQLPPFPQLPYNIHPAIVWGLILLAAVLLAVTFFRFVFSEPAERVPRFFAFFLALVFIMAGYLAFMNGPAIVAFLRRLSAPIFHWG